MKWLTREPQILSGLTLALLMVVLGLREVPAPDGGRVDKHSGAYATASYMYTGPSGSYAATPHVGSLTYSMPSDASPRVGTSGRTDEAKLTVASGEAQLDPRARVESR